ncbi:MAG: hypothetical protein H0T73_09495, partial [Ardenticatenales bacterium]|nr:hypothetical protein [Ardenticatenales bacterium]
MIPEQPCATPNGALNHAGFVAGDIVLVAAGRYTNTQEENAVVWLAQDAYLSGGWDATFTEQNGTSFLDIQNGWSSVHVLSGVVASMDRFSMRSGSGLQQNIHTADPRTLPLIPPDDRSFGPHQDAGSLVSNNGTFTLTNSHIAGLFGGFGLWNEGTFFLGDSTVEGIYPAGVLNLEAGELTLYRSQVQNNFGICAGINNEGKLVLIASTVSHNSTRYGGYGGGIRNRGSAFLVNSTISDNST